MVVSNLSFLNCDVFIKFNRQEYMENDYLKERKKERKHCGVATDERLKAAGQ